MNKLSPKSLLYSKWTKVDVSNKEKHFVITNLSLDEDQRVTACMIEAIINKHEYAINWRDLKDSRKWIIGWQ
jgi:tryptophan-rich hypothetical protein